MAWRAAPQPSGRPGGIMALSNRDRVGRAFELLAAGLGPYVDRRMRTVSPSGADWLARFAASARPQMQGIPSLDDPALQLRVLADSWDVAFREELTRSDRNLVFELRNLLIVSEAGTRNR